MTLILQNGYWAARAITEAPVHVSVDLADKCDDAGDWRYKIEVKLADFRGIAMAMSSAIKGGDRKDAERRVYLEVIEILAELLATRVTERVS